MNERFKELLNTPVMEWAHLTPHAGGCNVYVCEDGVAYINRNSTADEIWQKCIHPSYLLKALVVTGVCRDKDYVNLIMKYFDMVLKGQRKEFNQITSYGNHIELYALLNNNKSEITPVFESQLKIYEIKLDEERDDQYATILLRIIFRSLIAVYIRNAYHVEDCVEYIPAAAGMPTFKSRPLLVDLIKSTYVNPFAVA